jgi:hypothetical protein
VTLSDEGFVETALGFHEAQQALIQDNGHVYDQITGPDEKTGETRSAYFDVGALFAGQARQLALLWHFWLRGFCEEHLTVRAS